MHPLLLWPHLSLKPHFLSFLHSHKMKLSIEVYFTTLCLSSALNSFLSLTTWSTPPTFSTPGNIHLLLCVSFLNPLSQNPHSLFDINCIIKSIQCLHDYLSPSEFCLPVSPNRCVFFKNKDNMEFDSIELRGSSVKVSLR